MGRPRTNDPRTQQLNLSFTVRELEGIRKRAHDLAMRPSNFCRSLLLNTKSAPVSVSGTVSHIHRLIHNQLIRLGNNLNQMVRHLHQTGDPLPADLEPLLNDIRKLIARLGS